MIDLRSDTVTRPTLAMREAMFAAEVGDDVYGEDPSINLLEAKTAETFGMEAGLFCPSGTMTNQIAIRLHTRPQDAVICYEGAHIYYYEGGGIAYNSLASVRLIKADFGILSPAQIEAAILPEDVHYPRTSLVALENTVNRGGGAVYTIKQIAEIAQLCQKKDLKLHLDGARVFNALIANGENPKEYGQYFDSISVCFSKGLGCPVGSVLLGSKADIREARRIRKVLGGGMRQAGYLAAAGLFALEHHVARLAEDHQRAQQLAQHLASYPFVKKVLPVATNIVIFYLQSSDITTHFQIFCREKGILIGKTSADSLRLVTHLQFDDDALEQSLAVFKSFAIN